MDLPPNLRKSERDALRLIAKLFAPYLIEVIGLPAPAENFDLADSPAGKRCAYRAARDGEIDGAKKIRRKWFASRAAHDSWLETITSRPKKIEPAIETEEAPTSLSEMRKRLGLRKVG